MKILISYATNSGGCFLIAEAIARVLSAKHEVTIKKAAETTPQDFALFDCIILGSPSWIVKGKDGMPIESMLKLVDDASAEECAGKKFAFYGTGDDGFTHFCGAVDYLEKFVEKVKGKQAVGSLRVNEYYFRLHQSEDLIAKWANNLATKL